MLTTFSDSKQTDQDAVIATVQLQLDENVYYYGYPIDFRATTTIAHIVNRKSRISTLLLSSSIGMRSRNHHTDENIFLTIFMKDSLVSVAARFQSNLLANNLARNIEEAVRTCENRAGAAKSPTGAKCNEIRKYDEVFISSNQQPTTGIGCLESYKSRMGDSRLCELSSFSFFISC